MVLRVILLEDPDIEGASSSIYDKEWGAADHHKLSLVRMWEGIDD